MRADGSIIIDTKIRTDGMEAGFEQVKNGAGSVAKEVEKVGQSVQSTFSKIDVSKPVANAMAKVRSLEQQLERVTFEYKDASLYGDDKATETLYNRRVRIYDQLAVAREKLAHEVAAAAKKEAAAEAKAADKAAKAAKKAAKEKSDATKKQFAGMAKSAHRFGTRLGSIVSGALVFNLISAGLRNVTEYFGKALKSNDKFSQSLSRLKSALLTAFQPIYEVALPAILALMDALTTVVIAIGQLFSLLGGKSYQQMADNAEALNKQANAFDGVGGAAQKAKKQLAGFDELNVLQDNTDGAGGVGAGTSFDAEGIDTTRVERISQVVKDIAGYISVIVAALGGLRLGKFITDLLAANIEAKTLKETIALLGKKAGLTLGITLAITGIALETKGIIGAVKKGLNKVNFAEILGGGGSLISGGALIGKFFGNAILGGAIGAIAAGIPAFFTGIYDSVVNGIDWLSASLTAIGATAAGAGIGSLIGSVGGPLGALIGFVVGAVIDLFIWLEQEFSVFSDLWDGVCDIWSVCSSWFNKNVIQPVGDFFSDLWGSISQWASDAWESIQEFFSPAIEWFSELFGSVGQTISDIFYNIGVIANGCWEIIKIAWDAVSSWFDENVVQPVAGFFEDLWNDISGWAIGAWEDICGVFSDIATWFDRNVIQPVAGFFEDLWGDISKWANDLCDDIKKIFGTVVDFFKGLINGIIKALNSAISWIFGGINDIIKGLKNIEIAGAKPLSGLKTIAVPQIPLLAQGAVLPPNKPFMAVVGDQKHGTNIEAPLATIQEAFRTEVGNMIGGMMAGFETSVEVQRQILEAILGIEIGDTTIGEAASRYNTQLNVIRGG